MNLRFPEVQTCCCCISLRTGAKLIGFMSLVAALFITPMCVLGMTFMYYFNQVSEDKIRLFLGNIVVQVIQMTTSFLLIFGIYQGKSKLMLPWLVSTVAAVILEMVVFPSVPGFLFFRMSEKMTSFDINLMAFSIFAVIDDIYGWFVVFSYYRTLVPNNASPV